MVILSKAPDTAAVMQNKYWITGVKAKYVAILLRKKLKQSFWFKSRKPKSKH